MSALDLARMAYSTPGTPVRTARSTEYDAFARVTSRLQAAVRAGKQEYSSLVSALHDNRQLWTMLAGDVADPENSLPAPLRAQIFYLYEFTAQHSSKVLAGAASADVLVEINTAVMRGLRDGGGGGE